MSQQQANPVRIAWLKDPATRKAVLRFISTSPLCLAMLREGENGQHPCDTLPSKTPRGTSGMIVPPPDGNMEYDA